ncbi:fimbrillin family protein [Bacteroides oleiciplenus]|uniref:GLUG domain-containing protein n=2 Tax=Bacteroides oleiciplenus TaxID=626931 RepID=K9E807_9BACE|nr:fimbrillin family protein [Bacteroides oleiciplenus]EKU92803.1 hypothetical protein HMPREF9447_00460 [Bacteroides oleiciplenus YIT 12058]RGN32694.1 hypothetical protein DXB65_18210 [Bacteroides oleiciplenus]
MKTSIFAKTGRLFLPIAIGLLILSACSQNDEVSFVDDNDKTLEIMTIVATQGGALTRMTHDDTDNHGLIVKWTENDAFRVYSSNDTKSTTFAIPSPYVGNGKIAEFKAESNIGVSIDANAFFPDSRAEKKWADCYFSVLGQIQDASKPRAHLADYNFMTAIVTFASTSIITINFLHKIAVLKFMVTLPTDVSPKSISLSTQDEAGIVVAQKASDESILATAKQLTMSIVNATSNEHTAYMAILPSTLSQQLAVAVTGSDGMVYNYTVSFDGDFSYEAGRVYNSKLTLKNIVEEGYGIASEFDNDVAGVTWDQSDDKGSTEDNPYLIENASHLKYLIEQVEAGEAYLDKYFKLTTDIKVTANTWTPIGISSSKPFSGNFDGGGHTISGELKGAFSNDIQHFGFWGYVRNNSNATLIQNLHIAANVTWSFGSPEGASNSEFGVGGVAGYIYMTSTDVPITVRNCTISGEMQISDGSLGYGYLGIGGIVGNASSHIQNCSATGKTNVNCKGGIVRIGGIIGKATLLTNETKYCVNSSSIILSDTERSNTNYSVMVGGIAGYHPGKVLGCCNQGSISGNSLSSVDIGGIVGMTELANCHFNRNLTKDFNTTSNGTVRLGYLIGFAKNSTVYSCNESVGDQSEWIGSNPAWTPATDDESAH